MDQNRNTGLVAIGISASPNPQYCVAYHRIGKLGMAIHNIGAIGNEYGPSGDSSLCRLGYIDRWKSQHGGTYPRGSFIYYLFYLSLWAGAVVGNDTLVSTGVDGRTNAGEFDPDEAPLGAIKFRSTKDPRAPEYEGAVSEEDYIALYTDTFTQGIQRHGVDYFGARKHIPMRIDIRQQSYAWSMAYADDFILLRFRIQNIGDKPLNELYIGYYVDGDVLYSPDPEHSNGSTSDDLCGFLKSWPSSNGCGLVDTLDISWIADNDGDPKDGQYLRTYEWSSCTSVQGLTFLQIPSNTQEQSFNWWGEKYLGEFKYMDYGPRAKPTLARPYRDFGNQRQGTPDGDRNKYYVMRNQEHDFDQIYTDQIRQDDPYWIPPPMGIAAAVSRGAIDVRYLRSFGPYELEPNAEMTFAMAYVAGENLHRSPNNWDFLNNGQPDQYYANLDFSDLAKNAMWARWVYDNPGFDTDGDGYFGKSRICVLDSVWVDGHWVASLADTTFYEGDGVPDWRAALPPPQPTFWLYPANHGIRVRFNGRLSETTKDMFSGLLDFEGYRVYFGRDDREASLSLAASFDHDNYDKYVRNENLPPPNNFEIQDVPFSLEQLRCLYGQQPDPCNDSFFDPLRYTISQPLYYKASADSIFYFTKHDANQNRFGYNTPIKKSYPDAPKPAPGDTVKPEAITPDGYLKYYEYECLFDNLLPTVPYYLNVTAFDFGSPKIGLMALENSKTVGAKSAYPLGQDSDTTSNRQVYIYPNPYRADGNYRREGYEGRGMAGMFEDRLRRIHFANLPAKCIIRIFTLDGDLVRALNHDMDPSDPNSTHDTWDLINRNIQLVVSGLYYWTVEDNNGKVQMGKLVILF